MARSPSAQGSDILRQIVTLVAIAAAFFVNVLSNFYPPQGLNIGEIANTIFQNVQVLPANYAFAIWGLIYLGLFAFGIYQALPQQRENGLLRRIDYWLVIACIAQIAWVYLFLNRAFVWSIAAMLGILIPLCIIYLHLRFSAGQPSRRDRWMIHTPLSIYLAWISVATIVNIASTLDVKNWNGWGISPQSWTIFLILAAGAIAATILFLFHDTAFTLVIVWALVAIAVRQWQTPSIVGTALVVAIVLTLTALFINLRTRRPEITEEMEEEERVRQ